MQVNGKLRGRLTLAAASDEATVVSSARQSKNVSKYLDGMTIVKTIFIQDRLLNLVVKPM